MGFTFVLLVKSHLQSYPCPLQINFFWNLGFLLGIAIMLQIVTGIFLGLHYTSDLNSAYSSVFFLFHFILPFLLCGFVILHLFYLHFHSSNNPLRLNTNNKIPFFPFIFLKDFLGLILILSLYFLQTHFGISSLSHPDNALEACALLTPLHIVPEWYF